MLPARLTRLLIVTCVTLSLATTTSAAPAHSYGKITFDMQPMQSFPGDWSGYHQLVGDVNGDGRSDLIWNRVNSGAHNSTYVGLTGEDGSFTLGPLSEFSGNWRYYRPYTGDFNGDGRTDLLWNSICQGSGCANTANFTAIGLSNGDGTFDLQPTQKLGGSGWSTYRTRVADVDGDGRDDVIFNHVGNGFGQTAKGANYIYVATSAATSGDGVKLTLGSQQTVGLSGWDNYNVTTGDVNGDARADLIWATQCFQKHFLRGGEICWVGQNNRVAVGLGEPGGFAVFPPQSIGVDGSWGNYSIYEGNVDGDGRSDFVWVGIAGADSLDAFVGRGADSGAIDLGPKQTGSTTTHSASFNLVDIDGDGTDELIANTICQERNPSTATCEAGRTLLTIGYPAADGAIDFTAEQELPAADLENLGLNVRHPKADYNGDGIDDLLWSTLLPNGNGGTANILLVGLTRPPVFSAYLPAVAKS